LDGNTNDHSKVSDSNSEINETAETIKDIKKSFGQTASFIKKNYPWIILSLLLIFGFYLRIYHSDYPVVGYHNWKETHYLTEARNYARDGFFQDGFLVPHWD